MKSYLLKSLFKSISFSAKLVSLNLWISRVTLFLECWTLVMLQRRAFHCFYGHSSQIAFHRDMLWWRSFLEKLFFSSQRSNSSNSYSVKIFHLESISVCDYFCVRTEELSFWTHILWRHNKCNGKCSERGSSWLKAPVLLKGLNKSLYFQTFGQSDKVNGLCTDHWFYFIHKKHVHLPPNKIKHSSPGKNQLRHRERTFHWANKSTQIYFHVFLMESYFRKCNTTESIWGSPAHAKKIKYPMRILCLSETEQINGPAEEGTKSPALNTSSIAAD